MAANTLPEDNPASNSQSVIGEDNLCNVIGRANRLLDAQGGAIPTHLNFGWRGIDFKVQRTEAESGTHQFFIEAHLGYMPFSAENAAARQKARQLSRFRVSPKDDRMFRVEQDGSVWFQAVHQEDGIDSLPEMLKIISHRVIELSDRLEHMRSTLTLR